MTVAYQGIEGAFSHDACLLFLPGHRTLAFATFSDVVAAVEGGKVDLGMLPLANNEAGETGARELIGKSALHIVDEPVLPVRMHLLGLKGAQLSEIRMVVSHPVALRQCAQTLSKLGLKTKEASNTALAAKALRDPSHAVLASETAAATYGLEVLRRDVHDRPDNATTFAIVQRSSA